MKEHFKINIGGEAPSMKKGGHINIKMKDNIILIDKKYTGKTIFSPTFEVPKGSKVYVNGKEQVSGKTEQDFLNSVTYQLVDKAGKERIYKVAVNYKSKEFNVTPQGAIPQGAISGANEKLTTAIIGEYMNGVRVTQIAKKGFINYFRLTKLRLPNSLKHINNFAFVNCSRLTGALTLPVSLVTIKEWAFKNCSGFTGTLSIPSSVTSIGDSAFSGCNGFTGKLIIPSSVTSIKKWAFSYCKKFSSLIIPSSITTIGSDAFYGCSGFTGKLIIPSSVTSIGDDAFAYCSGFRGTLIIPSSVTSIGNGAFNNCSGFTGKLIVPSSVTSIGDDAFAYCSGFIGTLIIPNSVIHLGEKAFNGTQIKLNFKSL